MKMLKKLSAIVVSALLLAGCNETKEEPDIFKDDTSVIDIDDVIVEEEETEEEIEHKTCKEIIHGSVSGSLVEIDAGRFLETGCNYTCAFTPSTTIDQGYSVKSDDNSIAYITHEYSSGSFVIHAVSAGDIIVTAYDSNESLVLQMLVQIRNRVDKAKIGKMLYNTPIFVGIFGGYQLSFLSDNPLKGFLTGVDDFESSFVHFECTNCAEETIYEFNYYKYDMQLDLENSSTMRTYTGIYISVTGDEVLIYYTDGLVDMFRPSNI